MFKLTKFTKEEKKEIKKKYKEWDEIENEIWVEDEIKDHLNPYIKKKLKLYPFVKKHSEIIWLIIKLKDFELHTSEWIERKIKENNTVEFENFSDEVLQRILLEECEKHTSPFIEEEIKKGGIKTFKEELDLRIILEECEKHTSSFIEKEIIKLKDKGEINTAKEELQQRIWFEEYEKELKNKVEPVYDDGEMFEKKSLAGLDEINWFKKKLNEVGKGFCLAKWNQVSILLQTGMTHSCHHPIPHKIPLSELEANPTALHNTNFKKEQRKQMLNNQRPPECEYCWNVEDLNEDSFSDRHFKSAESWAYPDFDKIKNSDWKEDTNPPYVEISFSNKCNMRCMYCDVKSSSRWQSEIKSLGPYPTRGNFNNVDWLENEDMMPINYGDHNPYTEAFMNWWPDLYKDLHTFRITGGEPLLHDETFKVLDYIIEHHEENPNLLMSINSNCSVPEDIFDKFIEKIKIITDNKMVKGFGLYTSIEADGSQAEYIRDGLNVDRFWKHINKFLKECEKPDITIMATYNILSISTYDKVIEKVFNLKQKYYNGKRYRDYAIILDTSYLRYPEFHQARIISTEWIDKIKQDHKLMLDFSDEKYIHIKGHGHTGYYDFEIEKFRRLIDWIESPLSDISWLLRMRKDFVKMIIEYDKRRQKNFLDVFPEYQSFFENCKKYI
jgi:organic radical activating enzyme